MSLEWKKRRRKRSILTTSKGASARLSPWAEAFGEIDETTKVGAALAEGDLEKATDELKKLDFKKMSVRDRQAFANKLKATAETIRSR
ncbi:MAG: hypothetical protein J6K20_11270 [Thermoguttaceae bacterium]|nr:hypothetical protein [Thermoguttaceae bacterium]